MRIAKALIISFFILCSGSLFAQYKIEAQIGGGNYKGVSLNTELGIKLSQSGIHKIHPSIGLGFMFPSSFPNTVTIHSGLNYTYKNWGAGIEVNGFTDNPFWGPESIMYVDMILYPNINYHISIKSHIYVKLSLGAFIGFAKERMEGSSKSTLEYIGETNPGAGLSIGYSF